MIRDVTWVSPSVMMYALLFALTGSTLLVFLLLFKRGRLDMDEEAKYQMLEDEEKE